MFADSNIALNFSHLDDRWSLGDPLPMTLLGLLRDPTHCPLSRTPTPGPPGRHPQPWPVVPGSKTDVIGMPVNKTVQLCSCDVNLLCYMAMSCSLRTVPPQLVCMFLLCYYVHACVCMCVHACISI